MALAELSATSTPTNRTPDARNRRAAADRTGASWWQTVHHDPQKFSTTTCPRPAARLSLPPLTSWPETRGSGGCLPAVNTVIPGIPAVDPDPGCWAEQAAASMTASAAAAVYPACA